MGGNGCPFRPYRAHSEVLWRSRLTSRVPGGSAAPRRSRAIIPAERSHVHRRFPPPFEVSFEARLLTALPYGRLCGQVEDKEKIPWLSGFFMVGRPGIEPGTSCLSSMRSNQLS